MYVLVYRILPSKWSNYYYTTVRLSRRLTFKWQVMLARPEHLVSVLVFVWFALSGLYVCSHRSLILVSIETYTLSKADVYIFMLVMVYHTIYCRLEVSAIWCLRSSSFVLSSFVHYNGTWLIARFISPSKTTGDAGGTGTDYPFGLSEFILGFSVSHCWSFVLFHLVIVLSSVFDLRSSNTPWVF